MDAFQKEFDAASPIGERRTTVVLEILIVVLVVTIARRVGALATVQGKIAHGEGFFKSTRLENSIGGSASLATKTKLIPLIASPRWVWQSTLRA